MADKFRTRTLKGVTVRNAKETLRKCAERSRDGYVGLMFNVHKDRLPQGVENMGDPKTPVYLVDGLTCGEMEDGCLVASMWLVKDGKYEKNEVLIPPAIIEGPVKVCFIECIA